MRFDILPINEFQFEKVCFYTVILQQRKKSEFENFSLRMMNGSSQDLIDYGEIVKFITKIGESEFGARIGLFKKEDDADRLLIAHIEQPKEDNPHDFGLRLYCYRFSEKVVILFNGSRKTTQKVLHCPNCKKFFRIANLISRELDKEIQLGNIEINDVYIDIEEGLILSI